MKSMRQAGAIALLMACAMGAAANDKTEYDRRSAARDMGLFQSLDRDVDGTVTRLEAEGDLNFAPRFADMDINRDDVVTTSELQRYIEQQYGTRR